MNDIERMKIKKVEIQAFRAYEKLENSTFDFTTENGEISNFVALYAPNGFGKTSFYDAVEWGMTNNIRRFLKNKNENILSAKAENSMYILRNHNAERSLESYVNITAECGDEEHIFSRVLPHKLRQNQRDAKFDRKETDSERTYFLDVLLSQEEISSFLKEDDSASRYEKFVNAFGDKELDKNYKIIADLITTNKEKIKNYSIEIKGLKEGVKTEIDGDVIKKINEIIIRLEQKGMSIPILKSDISEKDNELLELSIIENNNKIQKERVTLSNDLENLHKIISNNNELDLGKYSVLLEEIKNIEVKISLLHSNLKKWRLYNKRNKLLYKVNGVIDSTLIESREINEIKNDIDHFLAMNEEASLLRAKVKGFEEDINKVSSDINVLELNKTELTSKLNSVITELTIFNKRKKYLSHDFKQNNKRIKFVSDLDSKIYNLQKEIENNKREIELLLSDSEYWVKINKTIDADGFSEKITTKNEEVNSNMISLLNDINFKNDISNELKSVIERIKITEHLDEKLNNIINIGLEFISESGSHHCPLCSTDHKDLDTLVNEIKNNPLLADQHRKLIVDKNNLQNKVKEYDEKIIEKSSAIKVIILKITSDINKLVSKSSENILQNEMKLTNFTKDREVNLEVTNKFKIDTRNLSEEEYTKWLDDNLSVLNSSHLSFQEKINTIDLKIKLEKTNKNTLTEKVSSLILSIQKIQTDERYCYIVDFLERKSWGILTKQVLQSKEKYLSSKLQKATHFSNRLEVAVFNLSLLLPNEDSDVISEALSSIKIKKIELTIQKDNFINNLSDLIYIPIPDVIETPSKLSEIVVEEINKYNDVLANLNETLLDLKLLSDVRRTLSVFITREKNKEKIINIEFEIKFLRDTYNKRLISERDFISKKIQEDISDFFYLDLINTFYSKIDPHPKYKDISFRCDFFGDKPRLHVFVKSEESEIIPTLYFSAAQLNTLSLSIFLAKALNVHDPLTERVVDCIFIDDPIQAMDSINILSVIDLLRSISCNLQKQIILSTHDVNFYNLLKKKVPSDKFNSCFIELESYGIVKR